MRRVGGGAEAGGVAGGVDGGEDDGDLVARLELLVELEGLDGGGEGGGEGGVGEVLGEAGGGDGVLEGGELLEDVAGEGDLLRAFDDADNAEVEREVQAGPDELADGAEVGVGGRVEVEDEEERLEGRGLVVLASVRAGCRAYQDEDDADDKEAALKGQSGFAHQFGDGLRNADSTFANDNQC